MIYFKVWGVYCLFNSSHYMLLYSILFLFKSVVLPLTLPKLTQQISTYSILILDKGNNKRS